MNGIEELIRQAATGLRVVNAAEVLRRELESTGERDPAGLVLADLLVRHATAVERAAMALQSGLYQSYRKIESDWGEP